MSPRAYDFRKPPRLAGGLEQRLESWLRSAAQLAGQRCQRHVPLGLEVTLRAVETLRPEDALARLPEAAVGFRALVGEQNIASLFVWPRPLALALVGGALGNVVRDLPPDRDLTVVEESLCEYLMQQLLAAALCDTWPGPASLPVAVRQREPAPRWARLLCPLERVLLCTFAVGGVLGEQSWYWLAPPQGPLEELASLGRPPEAAEQVGGRKLESFVRELPVEVVIDLGSAEVTLSQLAALKPGDLLILGQRVSEPLPGRIDGKNKFRAWPGRVGSRQAVQVESLNG